MLNQIREMNSIVPFNVCSPRFKQEHKLSAIRTPRYNEYEQLTNSGLIS